MLLTSVANGTVGPMERLFFLLLTISAELLSAPCTWGTILPVCLLRLEIEGQVYSGLSIHDLASSGSHEFASCFMIETDCAVCFGFAIDICLLLLSQIFRSGADFNSKMYTVLCIS